MRVEYIRALVLSRLDPVPGIEEGCSSRDFTEDRALKESETERESSESGGARAKMCALEARGTTTHVC